MSSFNPFATILYQNKLVGPNYIDWKRNLDIVITIEGHKYVLSQPCVKLQKCFVCHVFSHKLLLVVVDSLVLLF
jgi:mRNA-degrading endonuclease HigB of HigAB toxin-antitoxin module